MFLSIQWKAVGSNDDLDPIDFYIVDKHSWNSQVQLNVYIWVKYPKYEGEKPKLWKYFWVKYSWRCVTLQWKMLLSEPENS